MPNLHLPIIIPRKQFLIALILLAWFAAAFFFQTADAVDEIKTLSYFVGQATSSVSSVSWPFTFYIGDTVTSTKSAFFEISGISPAVASLTIDLSLGGGSGTCPVTRTLDTTGRSNEFRVLYDVTSCITASVKGDYSRTLNATLTGGSVDDLSAHFFLTYQHTPPLNNGTTAMKTISYAADEGTRTTSIASGTSGTLNFSFYIGDTITAMKSAFFEVNGISLASASSTMNLTLGGGSGTCPVSTVLDTTGRENQFTVLYDIKSCINASTKGSYLRSLVLTPGAADVYIHSARLFLTYQFTPPSAGGFPVSGTLISPTFDTATVNGASYNWIMWKGLLNAGTIRLQLATSNCVNGATNPPTCTTGLWGTGSDYSGPDCTISTFYTQTATDQPKEIGCATIHNNKRYFRYKATICSANCSSAGSNTPQVDDIIVNWSP